MIKCRVVYKYIESYKRWVRKTDFFSLVQWDALWIKTGKIKQFRVSCSWATAESSLAATLAVTITLISHRQPLFHPRTPLCSLWTFINVTVLLREKCMYLSVRGNIKRGYESERERGKDIKWGWRGNDKVCWITGWHWKKPLCPFSLHLSIPCFTLCALFTSHTSSISTHWLSHPHLNFSPSVRVPRGIARVPVSAWERQTFSQGGREWDHCPSTQCRTGGLPGEGWGEGMLNENERWTDRKQEGMRQQGSNWKERPEEGRELEKRRGRKQGRKRKTAMADRKNDKSSKENNKNGIKIQTNGGKERWDEERRERRGNEEKMMNNWKEQFWKKVRGELEQTRNKTSNNERMKNNRHYFEEEKKGDIRLKDQKKGRKTNMD